MDKLKFFTFISIMLCLLIVIPAGFAADSEADINEDVVCECEDVLGDDYYFDSHSDVDGNGSADSPFNNFTDERFKDSSAVHLASGEYNLSDNIQFSEISIYGESPETTVLNGNGHTINVKNNLLLKNITLKNLRIQMDMLFTLNAYNTVFKDSGNKYSYGGAVFSYNVGEMIFTNCSFVNNLAKNGGAIYMDEGSIELYNTTFADNYAVNAGGAIYSNDVIADIYNSTFVNNSANLGGAVFSKRSVGIYSSIFENNTAIDSGGSVYMDSTNYLDIFNSNFTNNSAGFGGSLYLKKINLTCENSTFDKNNALFYGGSIISVESNLIVANCSYKRNYAGIEGGAIYNLRGNSTIVLSEFKNNSASVAGALFIDKNNAVYLKNNSFENNYAEFCANTAYLLSNTNSVIENNNLENENDLIETDIPYIFNNNKNFTLYTYNSSFTGELPSKYDLRQEGFVTPIKDQGSGGNCWSFAAIAALESCILKASGISYDLSEENMKNLMAYYSDYGWNMEPNKGGFDSISVGYLISWLGPVLESEDGYDPQSFMSPIFNSLTHIQNVVYLKRSNYTDNDAIKKAILDYGGVSTSICWNSNSVKGVTRYYTGSNPANHAVTIIGWDDNFSKYNFKTTPPGDGAWIIKNSHGPSSGDKGYWYISYYDTRLAQPGRSDISYTFVLNDTVKFDKNYQYDVPGKTDFFFNQSATVWYKNVFNATDNEYLAAVSTFFNKNTNWTVSVYVNNILKHSQSGFSKQGYWTIDLDKYVPLNAGDIFEIVFKITVDSEAGFPISEKVSLNNYFYRENISFLSYDGYNWTDLYNLTWAYSSHTYKSQVACIKAFTLLNEINSTTDVTVVCTDGLTIKANVLNQFGRPVNGGNITFTILNKKYTADVINGYATLRLNLTPGELKVSTAFDRPGYLSTHDEFTIDVPMVNTTISVDIGQKNPINITATVLNQYGYRLNYGNVTFIIDGEVSSTVDVVDGIAKMTHVFKTFTKHHVTAVFNSVKYYNGSSVEKEFDVYLIGTNMELSFDNYYNPVNIKAKITDSDGNPVNYGNVTFTFGGDSYTINVVNGFANITHTFNIGLNSIRAVYNGLYIYDSSTVTSSLLVKSTIVIPYLTKTCNSQFEIKLLDNYGNPLKISEVALKLKSGIYLLTTDEKGFARCDLNLNPGSYDIEMTNMFNGEVKKETLKIIPTISQNKDMTMYYGEGKYYNVKVFDDNGNVAKGVKVTFSINNKKYVKTTDQNGFASIKISLNPAKYTITAEYKGFKVFNKINVKSTIVSKNIKVKKGKVIKFTVKLLNKNGKILKNHKIKFKFKGKTYKIKTNKYGKATLKINKRYKVGKYIIITNYGKLNIRNTINIIK